MPKPYWESLFDKVSEINTLLSLTTAIADHTRTNILSSDIRHWIDTNVTNTTYGKRKEN